MESPNLIEKTKLLNEHHDFTESFSQNIDNPLNIKNNNLFQDNIIFKSSTEVFDKQINNQKFYRFIKDDEDQKNINDSLISEKETKTNCKKIYQIIQLKSY